MPAKSFPRKHTEFRWRVTEQELRQKFAAQNNWTDMIASNLTELQLHALWDQQWVHSSPSRKIFDMYFSWEQETAAVKNIIKAHQLNPTRPEYDIHRKISNYMKLNLFI